MGNFSESHFLLRFSVLKLSLTSSAPGKIAMATGRNARCASAEPKSAGTGTDNYNNYS